jgi:hypothetical protein
MKENDVVVWCDAIAKATSEVRVDSSKIGWDYEEFEPMAVALIDGPMMHMEMNGNEEAATSYGEFLEEDGDNWYRFICENFPEFGPVAKVIKEEGY